MKLTDCELHEKVKIEAIMLSKEQQIRLLHLGLYPGVSIALERIAPCNDPCIYEVLGNFIILRKAQASAIEVKRIGGKEDGISNSICR